MVLRRVYPPTPWSSNSPSGDPPPLHRPQTAVRPILPVLHSLLIAVILAGEGCYAGSDIKQAGTLAMTIGVATLAGSARALPTTLKATCSSTRAMELSSDA